MNAKRKTPDETRPTKDRRRVTRSLPHERDETANPEGDKTAGNTGPRQITEQAARDIARGLRDTDCHGTPSDVPGPGADPGHTPGADVPPGGVHPTQ
jgi:hypothetical protein